MVRQQLRERLLQTDRRLHQKTLAANNGALVNLTLTEYYISINESIYHSLPFKIPMQYFFLSQTQ